MRTVRGAGWALLLVLVGHEIAGARFGHEPVVDPIAHFSGGVAMAYFVWYGCRRDPGFLGNPSALARDLIALGATLAVAVFWEAGELGSDLFRGTRIQTDPANMMRDLMLGGLGGAVLLAGVRVRGWFRGGNGAR
ncbi:hypothetical protein ABI59_00750 [Acidobacteria bacterium Mor1]|nr:hypothetical protein ABI59_00750 [Acidobacteria bacterium Mor1]